MSGYKQDNKLMAKNSAFMYIQMAVKVLISLYTVRVILHALGAEDYGIYNVVGGFVTMFSFITSTLVSASQRFFSYAMGKNEYDLLNRYFNATVLSFLILSLILFVSIEAFGVWFVNCKMVIPDGRLEAANWVLHFAIIAFIVRVLAVPFKSLVIAHEKMIIFALISIFDSLLLLGIAYLLLVVSYDRLKMYSLCMFGVSLVSTFLYALLCKASFPESSKFRIRWEALLLKELLSYCGWYMFGTMANVVRSQGINILLNLFFNPVVNAARAIAYQINTAVNMFVNNFYQAVRPQITKLTASEENEKMLSLVYSSSMVSYILVCLVAIPLIVEMPFVLSFWLGDFPEYTIIFSRLVIFTAMIDTLGYPLATAVCAKGDIRNFQVITGLILLMNLPVSYCLLKLWSHPVLVFYVSIVISFIVQVVRILFMKQMFNMPVMIYIRDIVLRSVFVSVLSLLLSLYVGEFFGRSIWSHLLTIALSLVIVFLVSWFLGLKSAQRKLLIGIVERKILKRV